MGECKYNDPEYQEKYKKDHQVVTLTKETIVMVLKLRGREMMETGKNISLSHFIENILRKHFESQNQEVKL